MQNILRSVFQLAVLAVSVSVYAQDNEDKRVEWLRDNAVEVKTIDPLLEDDDLSDLMPLIEYIGDAQVVGLGEQTHGDGATFHAKTRLIKLLHQKMGFDVLVWESGMFDCTKVEEKLKAGESIKQAWREGIFGVWAMSTQVQPLFEYIDSTRTTDNPLEIAGMDSQMTSQNTVGNIKAYLTELSEKAAATDDVQQAFASLEPYFEKLGWAQGVEFFEDDLKAVKLLLQAIINEVEESDGAFAQNLSSREKSFSLRTLHNLNAVFDMSYWSKKSQSDRKEEGDMLKVANAREPAMAETLVWLAKERYPDKKLIVWAASSHLTYNSLSVAVSNGKGGWKSDDPKWQPMGNKVHKELGDDFYVIDFIAYDGEIGGVSGWSRPLDAAEQGTIDALCHETELPFLFVDLRLMPKFKGGVWLRERQIARPRGYSPMRTDWGNVCDAFFFTDKMFPSTFDKSQRGGG